MSRVLNHVIQKIVRNESHSESCYTKDSLRKDLLGIAFILRPLALCCRAYSSSRFVSDILQDTAIVAVEDE